MAFVGKSYKHACSKDENFEEFLKSLKIPEEFVQAFLKTCARQKLEKNGDTYTLISTDSVGTKTVPFRHGDEFEETVAPGYVAKTTFTVDGDNFTQVSKFQDGRSLTVKRHYTDKELVVILTNSIWDGFAKRYYNSVEI